MMRVLLLAVCGLLVACGDDDGFTGDDFGPPDMDADTTADTSSDVPTSDAPTSDAPTSDAPTSDVPTSDVPASDCTDSWPGDLAAFEDEVFAAINARRATTVTCGTTDVGPSDALTHDASLRTASRCQAQSMVDVGMVTGENADGEIFVDRAANAGYTGTTTGAVFGGAAVDGTADALVDASFVSPGNCMTLLDPDVANVGVGVADDGSSRFYEIIVGN